MAKQQISSLAVGTTVRLNINNSPKEFIIVHQGKPSSLYDDSCNGTWLLMKDIYEQRQWHSSNVNKLESSTIHSYLNSTFLNLFDSNIRDAIKQVKLPYRKNGGSGGSDQNGANGLLCKIFLLSGYEIGLTTSDNPYFPVDGAKLSYFEAGTGSSAMNKRIAYRNGSATFWWIRSPYTDFTGYVWGVYSSGGYSYYYASDSLGIRPALILPSTLVIDENGVISEKTGNTLIKTTSNTWKEQKQMFINTGASTTVPSGLVELEYIQSSGTQYIDTGFKPNQDTRLEMVCSPLSVVDANDGSGFIPYGAGESYTSRAFECYTTNSQYEFNYDGQYGFIGSPSTGQKLLISHNKNEIKLIIDGNTTLTKSFNYQSFTAPYTMTLFAIHRSSVIRGLMKLYACQIYDNGTLVRDFIPAKRISDSKCGLWDKVNLKFYVDESGGNFTAGAEKTAIAAIGTPLEYIESTGTQYLDTGITVNKSDNKELIMSCQLGNDSSYAGANGYMQYQASITGGAKGILKISYKNNIETIYFNDVLKLTQDWTSAYSGTNVKLGIFKLGETNNTWYNSSAQQIGKLYYYKLYDNGTLIRDFIPVKRISDNEYGLWDKVNKVFYSNAGTGTFTAGPAVNLTGWHRIKGVWAKTTADTWSQAL